jgi:membrane-associated protease RseP (regulator of RpoE activity)
MKKLVLTATACAALFCGCAHHKEAKTRPIFQRPWVGGHFETVPTPTSVRTNHSHFGKHGALLGRIQKDTPLAKAGLQESDLILAVNGSKVRFTEQIRKAVEKNAVGASTFTIYRNGELLEKSVTPGVERFQKINMFAVALSLSTHINVDVYPNPDFSLVALGFEKKLERLDLSDPKSKYLMNLAASERKGETKDGWEGLSSEEGWRFWLGPIWLSQTKSILSQE